MQEIRADTKRFYGSRKIKEVCKQLFGSRLQENCISLSEFSSKCSTWDISFRCNTFASIVVSTNCICGLLSRDIATDGLGFEVRGAGRQFFLTSDAHSIFDLNIFSCLITLIRLEFYPLPDSDVIEPSQAARFTIPYLDYLV